MLGVFLKNHVFACLWSFSLLIPPSNLAFLFFLSFFTLTLLLVSCLCHYHPLSRTFFSAPAGHRGNDEHCSERAARAGAAELSQARPRRGVGHPGAAANLRQQRRRSDTGQLQRVPQPHPRRHAEVNCQHWAARPPQHQLLQWFREHVQARDSATHGGAAQTPRFEAQAHGLTKIKSGPSASC